MNGQTDILLSHGEAMDRMYRWQRHVYDLTRRHYLLGRDELLDRLAPPPGGSILEIGCGTGRNLIGAAKRYPDARLFGIDISQAMLDTALENLGNRQLMPRTALAWADASSFDPASCLGQARFDRIFFSFALSMIPDWQGALRQAMNALGPRGELHIVDFGQCEGMSPIFRQSLFRWLKLFHVMPRKTLIGELHALASHRTAAVEFTSGFRGYYWRAAVRLAA